MTSISPPEGQDKTLPRFAPGPWRRGKSERFRNDIMASDGLPVAHLAEYLPAYQSLADANARLIAAAPALYEALETLVGLFAKRSPLDSELLGEQREEIAAAIAALNQVRAIL